MPSAGSARWTSVSAREATTPARSVSVTRRAPRRRPCAVDERRRELAPRARARPAPQDHGERHQAGDDHRGALQPCPGRVDEVERYREQREVEQRVQHDRRQEPVAQEDRRPDHRRHDELDQARVRREAGVIGMRGAEDHRLQHERDGDSQRAAAEMRADQRPQRERNRAKDALLPESGLQRNRDRHQRGHGGRQDVGIGQHLGGLPPAQPAIARVVERGDERELQRDEEVTAHRAPQHRARRAGFLRPEPPELRVLRKRAPREALGGHEHERVAQSARDQNRERLPGLAQPEDRRRLRGVETEPRRRRRRQRRRRHQSADDEPRRQRRADDEPVLAREPQHAEDASAQTVEEPRGHGGDAGDHVVRAAQLAEPALERLGHVDVRRDSGELVAGDRKAQPDARLAEPFRTLVDERVVDAAGRSRLLRLLEDRVGREVDLPLERGALLGQRARSRRIERLGRGVAHVGFRQPAGESVRRAVGPEADRDFLDLARLEDAHVPPVGRVACRRR